MIQRNRLCRKTKTDRVDRERDLDVERTLQKKTVNSESSWAESGWYRAVSLHLDIRGGKEAKMRLSRLMTSRAGARTACYEGRNCATGRVPWLERGIQNQLFSWDTMWVVNSAPGSGDENDIFELPGRVRGQCMQKRSAES